MRRKAHTAPTAPLVLQRTRIEKCATKKFGIIGQLRNKHFLIVILLFSLVKATMNDQRICKLRNSVNKTPQFLLFSTAKGRTKTFAHLSIAEG
jgi:hypothetical protein